LKDSERENDEEFYGKMWVRAHIKLGAAFFFLSEFEKGEEKI